MGHAHIPWLASYETAAFFMVVMLIIFGFTLGLGRLEKYLDRQKEGKDDGR